MNKACQLLNNCGFKTTDPIISIGSLSILALCEVATIPRLLMLKKLHTKVAVVQRKFMWIFTCLQKINGHQVKAAESWKALKLVSLVWFFFVEMSLFHYMDEVLKRRLSVGEAMFFWPQVVKGVSYLHSLPTPVIHKDIKGKISVFYCLVCHTWPAFTILLT